MNLVTITEDGVLSPGVRLADLSAMDNLPHLTQGVLVWEGGKRGLLRLDRKRPPEIFKNPFGDRYIRTASIGGYYPEQSCAPGERPLIADVLFASKTASHDTLVVAVALPQSDDNVPQVRVRRTPERKGEEWHPFAARSNSLIREPETDLVSDRDPVHRLYASFGETLRFTWNETQDWVMWVDSRDRAHTRSFTSYQEALADHCEKIDKALTEGMM